MQWWLHVVNAVPLDTAWLKNNPLPLHAVDVDKNSRGRVLIIGGCRKVPGGVILVAEAAFRAGAGKVTIATIASAAIPLGIALPACAIVALPETASGEIAPESIDILLPEMANYDAILLGPAMIDEAITHQLLAALISALNKDMFLVLDACALRVAADQADALNSRGFNTVFTPHEGELASLLGCEKEDVSRDPLAALQEAAGRFGAAIMIKGATTHLMAEGSCLSYPGGGVGLAVSGSGDVLAGFIVSLGAQGLSPLQAAAWGIWLHGEAGRRLAESLGPLGYFARELPPLIPGLMRGV